MYDFIFKYIKNISLFFSNLSMSSNKFEEKKPFYRILSCPDERDNNFHFQIIGKNVALKALPEKIMRDQILLGFSRADVALITYYGTKNEAVLDIKNTPLKPFKIIKEMFSSGKRIFLIETNDGDLLEYETSEIFNDPSLVKNFTAEDGIKIGYSAAEECFERMKLLR